MSYTLYSDSCCDLPQSYCAENGIRVLPLTYRIGSETFIDNMNSPEEFHRFYQRLREGEMPTTSLVSTDQFLTAFESALRQGEDVLYIGFSSALSGTYNSARLAYEEMRERYPERKIAAIDSTCASLGQGLLVHQAALLKEQGKSFEEVVRWTEENKRNVHHWFTVDDLHHLSRGGRLSGAAAALGTFIHIKPVLFFNDEGRLVLHEKVLGRTRSFRTLVDHFGEFLPDSGKTMIFLSHGDCPEDAQAVAGMIRERFGVDVDRINYLGPVTGTHSGPGTVALFFMGKSREASPQKV